MRSHTVLCQPDSAGVGAEEEARLVRELEALPIPEVISDLKAACSGKQVIKVCDNIWVAHGYSLSNIIFIVGEGGVLAVDTGDSDVTGREALNAWRAKSQVTLPITDIVYTHHHDDHLLGCQALAAESGEGGPRVWAHETFTAEHESFDAVVPQAYQRTFNQFGVLLPDSLRYHGGLGERLNFTNLLEDRTHRPFLPVTHFVKGAREEVDILGIRVVMLHAPGETNDQMMVWLPDMSVLCPGDNFYRNFPNIYAIRGVVARCARSWADAIDLMRSLRPEHVLGSHHVPLSGRQLVFDTLTMYRDGIRYMHDQTLRWVNKGMSPDQVVKRLKLPENLAACPWLHETYGTLEWSIKAVFQKYLGWFSGKVEDLRPLSSLERAERMVKRSPGGAAGLLAEAKQALADSDPKWALELASHVFNMGPQSVGDDVWSGARQVRFDAIKTLITMETSTNGRNWLLMQALEDHGVVQRNRNLGWRFNVLRPIRLTDLMAGVSTMVAAERAQHKIIKMSITITDAIPVKPLAVTLRNGVIETANGDEEFHPGVVMETSLRTMKALLLGDVRVEDAIVEKTLTISAGAKEQFHSFLESIDLDPQLT